MQQKTITIRVNNDVYKTFAEHAEAERRSISSFIEMAVLQYTKESEFVDIEEMSDILEDDGLIRRIKAGIADAKAKRGKFVA